MDAAQGRAVFGINQHDDLLRMPAVSQDDGRIHTTGIDNYFKLTVVNNDPGSEQGAQTCFYQDCRLVSIQPSKADVDTDVLEEDIEINFAGLEYGGNFADNTL